MSRNKCSEREPCWARALTSREIEVLKHAFQAILKFGRAPTTEEMRLRGLKKSDDCIIHTLEELEKRDLLLRRRGTQEIASIYPFSLTPTEHQIFLENGKRLFAMCAVDSLGMPIMFNRTVKIVSQCETCKQEIIIEVKDDEITCVSHPDIMIWSPKRQMSPAAETCCPSVNFFCCREHLQEWTEENPDLIGKINEIEQAFPKIKQGWKLYGKTLGFR